MEKRGDRVELVHTSDPQTRVKPGDRGTVRAVDGFGTVHVRWDNGSRLGLVPGDDVWLPANGEGDERS